MKVWLSEEAEGVSMSWYILVKRGHGREMGREEESIRWLLFDPVRLLRPRRRRGKTHAFWLSLVRVSIRA